jgi:hypothetical protein
MRVWLILGFRREKRPLLARASQPVAELDRRAVMVAMVGTWDAWGRWRICAGGQRALYAAGFDMADTDGAVVVDGGKDLESGSLDCGGSGYDMGKGKLWAAFRCHSAAAALVAELVFVIWCSAVGDCGGLTQIASQYEAEGGKS